MAEVPSDWLDKLAERVRLRLQTLKMDRAANVALIDYRRRRAAENEAERKAYTPCRHCAEPLPKEEIDKWKKLNKRTLRIAIECPRCKQVSHFDRGPVSGLRFWS